MLIEGCPVCLKMLVKKNMTQNSHLNVKQLSFKVEATRLFFLHLM